PGRQRVHTYAAGFAVAPDLVVTAAETVAGATSVQVQPAGGDLINAEVVRTDERTGLALLKLTDKKTAYLLVGDSFAGGAVQCAAFPTPNLFEPEPEILAGSVVIAKDKDEWTTRLGKHPRYSGAPLVAAGKVVGVELGSRDNDMTALPTASLAALKAVIGTAVAPGPLVAADPRQAVAIVSAVREK
ncbi:MAG TPA: trypsin-like peptidase domain-containing protein, partial [Humisphaera sp.]